MREERWICWIQHDIRDGLIGCVDSVYWKGALIGCCGRVC